MAEQESLTPRMATHRPDYFATPENWEMRADMQTPANLRSGQRVTSGQNQGGTSWEVDGMSDSLSLFCGYGMYETPPGALLYRNQFDEACHDGSFSLSSQENETEMECGSEKSETGQEALTSERCDISPGSEISIDDARENVKNVCQDASGLCSEKFNEEVCSPNEEKVPLDSRSEELYTEPSKVESSEKENIILNSSVCFSEDIQSKDSEGYEMVMTNKQEITLQDGQGHDGQVVMRKDENKIEECIFERMDQQEMDLVEPRFESCRSSQKDLPPSHHTSFMYEVANKSAEGNGCSGQISSTSNVCSEALDISEAEKWSSEECGVVEAGFEITEYDGKASTESGTDLRTNEINVSLMNMDIPQNAVELDQLADFLKMDDPFQNQDERHDSSVPNETHVHVHVQKTANVDKETPVTDQHNSIQTEDAECRLSPKRTRRKKKTAAASERRRSVRIARRESLQHASVDTFRGVEHVNKEVPDKPTYSVNMDLNLNEQCSNLAVETSIAHSLAEPISADMGIFEHANIDLPMSKRGATKKNNRRRSVRLQKKDMKTDIPESVGVGNETNTEHSIAGNGVCDKVLLADFADFGLGDDWMPGNMFGESQFAKTPKKTPQKTSGHSGRRKSARLSGVPIPMLELHSKSSVKVSGVEGMNPNDIHQNIPDEGCFQGIDQPAQCIPPVPSSPPSSAPEVDLLENVGELPFEQTDLPEVKPRGRRKKAITARRRSVRLAKKPQMVVEKEADDRDVQVESSVLGNQQVHIERNAGVLHEPQTQDNICDETQKCRTSFVPLVSPVELAAETEMEWQEQEVMGEALDPDENVHEVAEPLRTKTKHVAKDTPLIGRKRVSRIQDKENDAVAPAPPSEDKENKGAAVSQTQEAELVERKVLSPNNSIKITKKIKQLYLNKGQDMKKHKAVNLETIFESPLVKGKGHQATVIGAKKMKRMVAFTETPWLGRPGRTKGKKTKKRKEVKRVLSSQRERCWKLDTMLSTLDDLSP